MRNTLQGKQTRLQLLFLVSLLGVLLVVGLALAELVGLWAALAYAVLAVGLVAAGAARARAARERDRERKRSAAGRTCTCCTTTQHDPVEVI